MEFPLTQIDMTIGKSPAGELYVLDVARLLWSVSTARNNVAGGQKCEHCDLANCLYQDVHTPDRPFVGICSYISPPVWGVYLQSADAH